MTGGLNLKRAREFGYRHTGKVSQGIKCDSFGFWKLLETSKSVSAKSKESTPGLEKVTNGPTLASVHELWNLCHFVRLIHWQKKSTSGLLKQGRQRSIQKERGNFCNGAVEVSKFRKRVSTHTVRELVHTKLQKKSTGACAYIYTPQILFYYTVAVDWNSVLA